MKLFLFLFLLFGQPFGAEPFGAEPVGAEPVSAEKSTPATTTEEPATIFLSTDEGKQWTALEAGLPEGVTARQVLQVGCVLYLTTQDHGLFTMPFGQEKSVWKPYGKGLPERFSIASLAAHKERMILTSWNKGIYISNDYGMNWQRSMVQPKGPAYHVAYGAGKWWAATEYGLFHSFDEGMTWMSANMNYSVNSLLEHNGKFFAALQNTMVVLEGTEAKRSSLQTEWAIGQLWPVGEYVYARTSKGKMIRSKDGLNWERPIMAIPGILSGSLPERLFNGLQINLPGDQETGYMLETDMGWVVTVKGAC